MQLKHIEYFLAAAGSKSFSQAAESLFVSQQTLSSAISAMENELGYLLFKRTNQGIALTAEGRDILEEAEGMLTAFQRWQNLKKQDDPTVSGDVYIAGSLSLCNAVMLDVILKLKELYPKINIHLYENKDIYLYNQVAQNSHIRIVLTSYTNRETRDFNYEFAKRHRFVLTSTHSDSFQLFINPASPLACQSYVTLEQLKDLTLACYPQAGNPFAYPKLYEYFSPNEPYHLSIQESILRLISANEQIAGVFAGMAAVNNYYIQQNLVQMLPIRGMDLSIQGCLMHPPANKCTSAEAVVLKAIKEKFQSLSSAL